MPRSQLRFCLEPIRQALLYPSGIMKSLSWELELEAEQKKPPSKHGHVNLCQYKKMLCHQLSL